MSNTAIEESLDELGVYSIKNNFQTIIRQGLELLQKPSSEGGFLEDSSCLKVDTPDYKQEANVLVIDVGGTHTKAGLAKHATDCEKDWKVVFDYDNDEFDIPGEGIPIQRFTKAVSIKLKEAFEKLEIDLDKINGVGIIWSNALVVKHLSDKTFPRGTTAQVTGYEDGNAYRKGEFFTKDLYDGFDIGESFLSAMREAGINPKIFIIGNDTVFTLKASTKADAGMVASTGANATDVDSNGIILNTEMGGIFDIDSDYLSEGDMLLFEWDKDKKAIKLEDLMAGKWLPLIFEGHVITLAKKGLKSLAKAGNYFSTVAHEKIRGCDLEKLINRDSTPAVFDVPECKECLQELREIASVLVKRAGRLAAAMAYFSLYNQLQRKDSVVLSLDSSQARHLKGYMETMESQLNDLVEKNKSVKIELQHPHGFITVPMKGLAEALIGELARI